MVVAAAVTGFFSSIFEGEDKPTIAVVEPQKASCIYDTAKANDGKIHFVTGDMDTIMAGLACGEPCTIAWDILNTYADFFIAAPEETAALGMRVLGNPLKGDTQVISGESGAAPMGVVADLLYGKKDDDIKSN